MIRFAVLGLVLAASTTVHAGTDQKAAAFVLCKNQKSVRTIRVLHEQNQENCTITYGKNGVDEVVGSNRSMSACKSILQSIKSNLQTSDWNCRDVSSATVTSSAEVKVQ